MAGDPSIVGSTAFRRNYSFLSEELWLFVNASHNDRAHTCQLCNVMLPNLFMLNWHYSIEHLFEPRGHLAIVTTHERHNPCDWWECHACHARLPLVRQHLIGYHFARHVIMFHGLEHFVHQHDGNVDWYYHDRPHGVKCMALATVIHPQNPRRGMS